ncbi:MAG: HAMP domain-containing histidine kinase [Ignavibacteria bacterium]|nr:HAMP domain-containing histidine kinase [Ignavibacteria bacterium]
MKQIQKRKNRFLTSIFWKISSIFSLTLLVLSSIYLYISVYTAEMYFQEAGQKLNAEVAPHIAAENKCFINGEANEEALKEVFHDVMIINPSIEVYLLNTEGKILTYFAPNKIIKLDYVPLDPIKEFIEVGISSFVMGVDPKNETVMKGFSASEVYEDSVLMGYMYVILGGEEYENATQFVFGSYMLRLGVRSMAITLIAAALISLIALAFITRNLSKIIYVTRRFKDGDLNARIKLKGRGELGEFADSFNEMADTIVSNIEEIKTMDTLRRELVANVSHDLRTPLATIQGYIETILMKTDTLSDEDKKKYMQTIFGSTERLKNLVEELFELSKLEARETVANPEAFSIAELVQDVQQKNLIIAEPKKIDLSLKFPYDLPLVLADIGMMEKVLQNLLDNAIKFTPEGGNITISLTPLKEEILLSVKDTGPGINSNDLPHIFDRYQKAERTNMHDNVGFGLGLAIVKKILEVHNITIDVKSTKGKGTAFSFKIPIYKSKKELSKQPELS